MPSGTDHFFFQQTARKFHHKKFQKALFPIAGQKHDRTGGGCDAGGLMSGRLRSLFMDSSFLRCRPYRRQYPPGPRVNTLQSHFLDHRVTNVRSGRKRQTISRIFSPSFSGRSGGGGWELTTKSISDETPFRGDPPRGKKPLFFRIYLT